MSFPLKIAPSHRAIWIGPPSNTWLLEPTWAHNNPNDISICSAVFAGLITSCLKNVPPLTCYNLDKHDPIAIIFGTSITEKIRNHTIFCFPTSPMYCFRITLRKRKPRKQRTCVLCVQHSPTAAALSTSFLLYHALNNPKLNALITRFRKSYCSMRMSRESKRLKESSTDWLNSGNALIQRVKNAIFVFTVLPGSAEAQVI